MKELTLAELTEQIQDKEQWRLIHPICNDCQGRGFVYRLVQRAVRPMELKAQEYPTLQPIEELKFQCTTCHGLGHTVREL